MWKLKIKKPLKAQNLETVIQFYLNIISKSIINATPKDAFTKTGSVISACLKIISYRLNLIWCALGLASNVPPLLVSCEDGTNYFLLKLKILAKREIEFTTKFAIARNV